MKDKSDTLKIEYINAQSLLGHFEEIESLILERKVDILCISETWLESNMIDTYVNIPHFNIYRSDKGRGGGVCMYVRNDLKVDKIENNVPKDLDTGIEDLWLTIQCRKLPSFIIGCIYRHPHAHANSFKYLLESFRSICLRNKSVYIFGDLNDDLLVSNSRLLRIIGNAKLSLMINKPTRITEHSATLIDPMLTNKPNSIIYADVIPGPIADHELITINIDIGKPKRKPQIKTFRYLKNYNQNSLCNSILDEAYTLNNILYTDSVDKQVDIFTNVFIKCLDTCAPVVTKEIGRPSAPWINEEIKVNMKVRDNLQKVLKSDRYNVVLQRQYKEQKKSVKLMIQTGKNFFYREKLDNCKHDIAETWKVIKSMNSDVKSNLMQENRDTILKKANDFNDYFANVGKNAFEKSQENFNDHQNFNDNINGNFNAETSFKLVPVDVNTIILTVKELNNTNAYGSDGIPFKFIRDSLPIISFYITVIVNTSIVTHVFPHQWKHPHILPFYKSGDKDKVSNYRPISLLPILSKILEKVIANQLMSYLETNKLLSNHQHGFRSNLSTESALMQVTDKLYDNIEKKKVSLLLLLDLSKAFDSVSHDILINKCKKLNIDPRWFQSYLRNRCQSVRIDDVISTPQDISYGVPQGSILGPILFIIFVNDISEYIKDCLLVLYADDTQLLLTGTISNLNDLIKRAEATLIAAKSYFQRNGLTVNEAKTQCIFIGSRQYISRIPEDTVLKFNDNNLTPSKYVKNLGVYMDQYMLFDTHIDEMAKKVTGILFYINRIKDRFETSTRIILVQSLVLSVLNYCSNIWGMTNKTQIERVQKLQNFAAKVAIGGARKYDHVSPILDKLEWLRMDKKLYFDICILVFKVQRSLLPEWLFLLPTVRQVRREVTTRQCDDLVVARTTSNIGGNLFGAKGPTLWNSLPKAIKETYSLSLFKSKLKKYLLTYDM